MFDTAQPAFSDVLQSLAIIPAVPRYHLSDPDFPVLDTLANHFGIHPLQIEDCRHQRQTARLEEHATHTFAVIKVPVTPPGEIPRGRRLRLVTGSFMLSYAPDWRAGGPTTARKSHRKTRESTLKGTARHEGSSEVLHGKTDRSGSLAS